MGGVGFARRIHARDAAICVVALAHHHTCVFLGSPLLSQVKTLANMLVQVQIDDIFQFPRLGVIRELISRNIRLSVSFLLIVELNDHVVLDDRAA